MTYQLSYGYNELWINGYFVTGYYDGNKFQFDTINGVEVMEVDSTADQDQMLHALNWAVDTYIVGGNDDTPTTDPTEDGEETEGDDQDDEPTPFDAETAIRLLEQGCVEENEGICITRGKGYNGNYDISIDHDTHLYEVVWVTGYHAGDEIMSLAEVINLIREEAERGAEFYWQVMPNNEWERTDAPTTEPTEDGDQDDEPTPSTGFEVVYGGEVNGAGGLDHPRVVIYSERASFEAQNPNWQELIDDAFQSSPYTNLGDIYLSFRPTGGYEIYPRQGATRADGTQAEIW